MCGTAKPALKVTELSKLVIFRCTWFGWQVIDMVIDQMLKSTIGVANTEDLIIEAVRDLVKDEIKHQIKLKIDEDPQLKAEMKQAVRDFLDAKMREGYAIFKLTKCTAELGMRIVPDDMKAQLSKDVAEFIEKEVSQVIEKI
jgi:adenosyl cobinamide kinase/adenosyl cobinamide phosphate guanylyltransferase